MAKPGDRGPKALEGWNTVSTTVFGIDHGGRRYDVEVDFFEWEETIALFVDGVCREVRESPASFELERDARIEVKLADYGLEHARLIHGDMTAPFEPARGSGEAWRRNFERSHPAASRIIAMVSWTVLAGVAVLELPQFAEIALRWIGIDFTSPIQTPWFVDAGLTIAAVAAANERALRMKRSEIL